MAEFKEDIVVKWARSPKKVGPFITYYEIKEPCGCVTQLKPIGTVVCKEHGEKDPLRTKEPVQ